MAHTNIDIKKLANSEIEITGEILADTIETLRDKALKTISEKVELKGFRKGHIPEDVLSRHVGELTILQESAELALSNEYPNIIMEHKIAPIGSPNITLTKLAPKQNVGFKIKTAIMPAVSLGDYSSIAKKIMSVEEKVEVSDEELDKTIDHIRSQKVTEKSKIQTTGNSPKEKELPELTDEFVKTLGNFENVADFKIKLRENILIEKKRHIKEKKRNELADAIIKKSDISIPNILIESELQQMMAQFKSDIERAGLKYDMYLEQIQKKDEDIKKEWRPLAERKAKLQLVLNKIAVEEKITPPKDQVDKEVAHLKKHYPDAPESRVKVFVETMLQNEKVFEWLESKK